MTKRLAMLLLFVFLFVGALVAIAYAATRSPLPVNGGVWYQRQDSGTCPDGGLCIWNNSNILYQRLDNVDTPLLGGGGGTLQQAYNKSDGGPVPIQEDTTRGAIKITALDAGQTALYVIANGNNPAPPDGGVTPVLVVGNDKVATSGTDHQAAAIGIMGARFSGGTSHPYGFEIENRPISSSPVSAGELAVYTTLDGVDRKLFYYRDNRASVGEVTFGTPADIPTFCTYPVDGTDTLISAFTCINSSGGSASFVEMGPNLTSSDTRVRSNLVGFMPHGDNDIECGTLNNRWLSGTATTWYGSPNPIGTGSAAGFIANTFTAATVGSQQQFAPYFEGSAQCWTTAGGGATNVVAFRLETQCTTNGANDPNVQFAIKTVQPGGGRTQGQFTSKGELYMGHHAGNGSAPTVTCGAATNCTTACTLGGTAGLRTHSTDTAGTIIVTTGAAACAAGSIATLAWANTNGAWETAPHVTLTAANSESALLSGSLYVDSSLTSTTQFIIKTTTALAAATEYQITYHALE